MVPDFKNLDQETKSKAKIERMTYLHNSQYKAEAQNWKWQLKFETRGLPGKGGGGFLATAKEGLRPSQSR